VVNPDDPPDVGAPLDLDGLFRLYSGYVAAIAHRLIGNPDDVDDVVQDVFLDAHKGLERVREPAAIRGWLAKITVRRSSRHLKRRRVLGVLRLGDEIRYENIADSSASLEQRAFIASVYELLDSVPASKRIAWTLRYVQGESMERVTEICGCSRATAHRWIASVQAVLKEVLGDE
jgi:RNA polymerase sigma-70 factor (ECF subfamily)